MSAARVSFHGVRGSTPFSAGSHVGFGGNTCCVVVDIPNENPIILDMGSGAFSYALSLGDQALKATALLTHLHWDHVAGLPFFGPVLSPGGELEMYGPPDDGLTFEQAIRGLITPPYFPVTIDDFPGKLTIHDCWSEDFEVSGAKVRALPVPHTSATSGYRLEIAGVVIVYIPDHQEPVDDPTAVAPTVLELADGADLLIHDGQYPRDLFELRSTWGHSTPSYAIEVARQAGVKSLALFSHDPLHDDAKLVEMEALAQERAASLGFDVFSAREGMQLEMG